MTDTRSPTASPDTNVDGDPARGSTDESSCTCRGEIAVTTPQWNVGVLLNFRYRSWMRRANSCNTLNLRPNGLTLGVIVESVVHVPHRGPRRVIHSAELHDLMRVEGDIGVINFQRRCR